MGIATEREIVVREVLHEDKWVYAKQVDVNLNNGKEIKNFLMIETKSGGFISVCARMEDGKFLFVRQCKPAAGLSIESVAGGKNPEETWQEAALREMVEESEHEPGKIAEIGNHDIGIFTQTDRIINPVRLFLAFDCKMSEEKLKGDEVQGIEHLFLTPEETLECIATGEIRDLPTVAGIFAHLYYEKK